MRHLAWLLAGLLVACGTSPEPPTEEQEQVGQAACYPTVCGHGVTESGPCSCPEVRHACQVQYGQGFERRCPALRSWASACTSAPGPVTDDLAARRCYPVACAELSDDDRDFCSCRRIRMACMVAWGEEPCPALETWASACAVR